MLLALRRWSSRRWWTALAATAGTSMAVAVPTALIQTPYFSREIPAPWWAWPALIAASALTGMLLATYVAAPDAVTTDRGARRGGWLGGVLTFVAVGCPVCNKLVLVAGGSAGALTWFEPLQPVLQLLALGLLAWALRHRLHGELSCPVTETRRAHA